MVHVKLVQQVTVFDLLHFEFISQRVLDHGGLGLSLEVALLIATVSCGGVSLGDAVDSAESGSNERLQASNETFS